MNARTKPAEALEVSLADIHEVRRMGARNSAFRSADQTAAALFWHCAPRSLWTEAASLMLGRGGDIAFVTRGVALVAQAMAQVPGLVAAEQERRPVPRPAALIRGDAPSRLAATSLDPSWEPLVHSSRDTGYPNSNCVVGGAVAGLLRGLLGNDGSPVSLSHPELGVTRSFPALSTMLQEVEDAKVWAGTHLRTTAVESTELGLSLARDLRRAEASLGRSRTR